MNSYTAPNSSNLLAGPFEPKPPVILPAPSYNIHNIHALAAAEASNSVLNRLCTPVSLSSSPTIPTPSSSPRSPLVYGNSAAYNHGYFEKNNNNLALTRKRPFQRVFENDYNQLDILSSITLKSQNYFVSANPLSTIPSCAQFQQKQHPQNQYNDNRTSIRTEILPESSPVVSINSNLVRIEPTFKNNNFGIDSCTSENTRQLQDAFGHDPFLCSDQTYSIFKPLMRTEIEQLLDQTYGGRLAISRKRKPLILFNSSNNGSLILENDKIGSNSSGDHQKKQKVSNQGRPFSSEMVIDLIFPKSLDDLYNMLCSKPNSTNNKLNENPSIMNNNNNTRINKNETDNMVSVTETHRVKLISSLHKTDNSARVSTSDGMLTFTNSRDMVEHFTQSSEFSVVTIFRQSSIDKSLFKRGTCPVLKFSVSPVYDFSVEYLKRIAYPRYKAGMKFFIIPKIFRSADSLSQISAISKTSKDTNQGDHFETLEFYPSAGMYLQDQLDRLGRGEEMNLKARIFHSKSYPDLPYCIYDKQLSQQLAPAPTIEKSLVTVDSKPETLKAKLNYILN